MKNPKALQESIEAAKLLQSHISIHISSINCSNMFNSGGFVHQSFPRAL
jgi:hypothetical protein